MTIKAFKPVPDTVRAIQYDRRNHNEIQLWGGVRFLADVPRHRMYLRTRARNNVAWDNTKQVEIKPTDWVCQGSNGGFFIMTNEDFIIRYTEAVLRGPKAGSKLRVDIDEVDEAALTQPSS
jgi:hypothetical protein